VSSGVGTSEGAASIRGSAPPLSVRAKVSQVAVRALAPDSAWSAVCIWVVWSLSLLALATVTMWFRPHDLSPTVIQSGLVGEGFLWPLRLWDYEHYLTISQEWYPADRVTMHYAFFPLWPAILALGATTIGAAATGTLVSLAASLAVFVGVSIGNPLASVRRTAIALACFPSSHVLLLAYPDGLALASAVWAWILASRDRWAAAAALGAIAALARPNGFLIAIPLFFIARRASQSRRWFAVLAPPLTLAAVQGYFGWRSGDVLASGKAAKTWMHVDLSDLLLSPLATPGALWELVVAAVAVGLCIAAWRSRMDRGSAAFATAVIAMKLAGGVVEGTGRRMLFAFPLVWAAANATWFRRPWAFAALGVSLSAVHVLDMTSRVPW
jgi:hypothetical protein